MDKKKSHEMSGECGTCSEHTLDCNCTHIRKETREYLRYIFLSFRNELAMNGMMKEGILFLDTMTIIDKFVDKISALYERED